MTDREILELLLKKITGVEQDVCDLKSQVAKLNAKMEAVFEEVAGLSEFRTETRRKNTDLELIVSRHEADIQLLKKVVGR